MNKFRIEESWLIESLPVWDWSNGYKYSNWMAIVTRDEKGMEHRDYLIKSKNKDEFFNLSSVKEGCIMQFSKNRTMPLLWENTQLTEKQRRDCKRGKKW